MAEPVYREEYFLMLQAKGGGEIDLKIKSDDLEAITTMADAKRTELMYNDKRPIKDPVMVIYKREIWEEIKVTKVGEV